MGSDNSTPSYSGFDFNPETFFQEYQKTNIINFETNGAIYAKRQPFLYINLQKGINKVIHLFSKKEFMHRLTSRNIITKNQQHIKELEIIVC